MSLSTEFTGRSKNHALQLLDSQKHHLPDCAFDFIAIAINSIKPLAGGDTIVHVRAFGHLNSTEGPYGSNATIEVRPSFIPD